MEGPYPTPAPPPFLAQTGFGLIEPPAPAPLHQPPFLQHYLVENPWPLAVLLAIGAAVTFLRLRNLNKQRAAVIAAGVLALAAGAALLLARAVETPRETIARNTAQLVAAAATVNIPALDTLLSEELSLYRPGGGNGLSKAEALDRVQQTLGGFYKVREWAVLDTQSMTDSPRSGVTQARLRITLHEAGFPNISWWRIDWRKAADGQWRAVTIEPISLTPEVRGQMK